MKKILFLVCLCLTTVAVSAQVSSNSGKSHTTFAGVDYVFMFNGITSSTEITYIGTGTVINWYKFTDTNKTNSISNQTSISPDDATGYTLVVDGKETTIWVIDYNNYKPVLTSITAQDNADKCNYVDLKIDANVPALTYQTSAGATKTITRNFEIAYTTLKWSDTAWANNDTTITITNSSTMPTSVTVKVPYKATTFTLSGDQFAEDLNLTKSTVTSASYTPVAVICHETSVVETRDAKNENERPTTAKDVSGSAPLAMTFYSNPNDPIVTAYSWVMHKDKGTNNLLSGRIDKTTPYTFTEAGSYVVKVTVSNSSGCTYSDSITVTVSTSSIQVPNVFTPNGDGMNDEFRVAFKSITSFHCWVYNRWGRLVYEGTDPKKGWDGNIGGKEASAGAYYYIIKALGADYDANSKPNSKTKLRVGEYKLKGDINLLR